MKERTNEWVNAEDTDKFGVVPLNDMKIFMWTACFRIVMKRAVVIL